MLYIGYLIILDGQSIKKKVSEISMFELPRPDKQVVPWTLGRPHPPPQTPK